MVMPSRCGKFAIDKQQGNNRMSNLRQCHGLPPGLFSNINPRGTLRGPTITTAWHAIPLSTYLTLSDDFCGLGPGLGQW
jgi:hypothetical protein